MLLIECPNTFEEYLKSLSKKAKKNYNYASKKNSDLTYDIVPFVREEVEEFMQLWEKQLIRGEYRQWAYPVGHVEDLYNQGRLRVFAASLNSKRVALHFIQKQDGFWECHPPMYEKAFGSERYLAKFMWFNLIRYTCGSGGILDLGGGTDESWQEMIETRDKYPNTAYKWMYVPKKVKDFPKEQKNYKIITTQWNKTLLVN